MTSSLAADFVAGVDPFGLYTSQYGQQAEQAGLSEAQHSTKKTVGMLGGAVGGGVVLPSVGSGLVAGIGEALRSGKGKALAGFGRGFVRGVKAPVKALSDISTVQKAVAQARSGKGVKLDQKQREAFKRLASQVRIGNLAGGSGKGATLFQKGRALLDMATGNLSKSTADMIASPLNTAATVVKAAPFGGAAIGATSAAVQYSKGREQERMFMRRQNRGQAPMYKAGSAEMYACELGYLTEMDKIASKTRGMERLGDMIANLGERIGGAVKGVERAKKQPGRLKRRFQQGYESGKTPTLKEELSDVADDLKKLDYGTLAVPFLVGGTGLAAGYAGAKAMRAGNQRSRYGGY